MLVRYGFVVGVLLCEIWNRGACLEVGRSGGPPTVSIIIYAWFIMAPHRISVACSKGSFVILSQGADP